MDTAVLIARAFDEHERNGGEKTLEEASDHDVNHITLNYIRHRLIRGYDRVRFEDQWQYFMWFAKLNRRITKIYPFLEQTVEQQIKRKEAKISLQKYESDEWENL